MNRQELIEAIIQELDTASYGVLAFVYNYITS